MVEDEDDERLREREEKEFEPRFRRSKKKLIVILTSPVGSWRNPHFFNFFPGPRVAAPADRPVSRMHLRILPGRPAFSRRRRPQNPFPFFQSLVAFAIFFVPTYVVAYPEFRAHRRAVVACGGLPYRCPRLDPASVLLLLHETCSLFSLPGKSLQHRSTARRTAAAPDIFLSGYRVHASCAALATHLQSEHASHKRSNLLGQVCHRAPCVPPPPADHGAIRAGHTAQSIAKHVRSWHRHAMSQVPFIFLPDGPFHRKSQS